MLAPDMAMSSHDLIDGRKLGRNDECSKCEKASFPSTRFLLRKIIVSPCPRVKTISLRRWENGCKSVLA